ncbi:MAG TPA: hypothetical protein VMR51_00295 [Patescibacteria group bacterium]|nr:hypothetical protein [Patescibacteria group bacterium]
MEPLKTTPDTPNLAFRTDPNGNILRNNELSSSCYRFFNIQKRLTEQDRETNPDDIEIIDAHEDFLVRGDSELGTLGRPETVAKIKRNPENFIIGLSCIAETKTRGDFVMADNPTADIEGFGYPEASEIYEVLLPLIYPDVSEDEIYKDVLGEAESRTLVLRGDPDAKIHRFVPENLKLASNAELIMHLIEHKKELATAIKTTALELFETSGDIEDEKRSNLSDALFNLYELDVFQRKLERALSQETPEIGDGLDEKLQTKVSRLKSDIEKHTKKHAEFVQQSNPNAEAYWKQTTEEINCLDYLTRVLAENNLNTIDEALDYLESKQEELLDLFDQAPQYDLAEQINKEIGVVIWLKKYLR